MKRLFKEEAVTVFQLCAVWIPETVTVDINTVTDHALWEMETVEEEVIGCGAFWEMEFVLIAKVDVIYIMLAKN